MCVCIYINHKYIHAYIHAYVCMHLRIALHFHLNSYPMYLMYVAYTYTYNPYICEPMYKIGSLKSLTKV